ncbi:MAG: hypothetical protein KJ737_06515 [Proteobacteria bacterium]|nr:hypothetical protein [Pseudomonadota bacterium]
MNNDPINEVDEVTPVISRNHAEFSKERKKRQEGRTHDEAGQHFDSLAQAAERAHTLLVQTGSPYRFCVYREKGDVFIDLVVHDENGKMKQLIKKNITHQEFTIWLERIENGDGLFFDEKV